MANNQTALYLPSYRSLLIDFSDMKLEAGECPEDLYQRLMAFVEDSLLGTSGQSHHTESLQEVNKLSPTLETLWYSHGGSFSSQVCLGLSRKDMVLS